MPSKKAIAWGCGIAAVVALLIVAAIAGFFFYVSQDVKGVSVSVVSPADTEIGQTFDLVVGVTNDRPRKVLALSDIDLGEAYLAGFTVSSIEPKPKSNMHVPLDNSRSFKFDIDIPPHGSQIFTFHLKAQKTGLFRGDVDVCEGARFITEMAQTAVNEPGTKPVEAK